MAFNLDPPRTLYAILFGCLGAFSVTFALYTAVMLAGWLGIRSTNAACADVAVERQSRRAESGLPDQIDGGRAVQAETPAADR